MPWGRLKVALMTEITSHCSPAAAFHNITPLGGVRALEDDLFRPSLRVDYLRIARPLAIKHGLI